MPGASLARTAQTWLPELGMYYYKARFYSPSLGRFVQSDPIGYSDGLNLYNYVGSDPVNNTDPSGLICAACVPYDSSQNSPIDDGDITVTAILDSPFGFEFLGAFELVGPGNTGLEGGGAGGGPGGMGMMPGDEKKDENKNKSKCDVPGLGGDGLTLRQRAAAARSQAVRGASGGFALGGTFGAALGYAAAVAVNANRLRVGGSGVTGGSLQGNLAFGATAAGLGIPLSAAQRFAGFYEQFGPPSGGKYDPKNGTFVGGAPFGDDPGAQKAIEEGFRCGSQ